MYDRGIIQDSEGTEHKFQDCVDPFEGRHLYDLIYRNRFTSTLEVGCAMGASAVWMCQAHVDLAMQGQHVSIDPNQTTQYLNIGRKNVQDAGSGHHHSVIELPSYRALPKLLDEGRQFELVFVDGWHTFDYTLVDFFLADLLIPIHGVIVVDDIKHPSVTKTIRYIQTNYPHYQLVANTPCSETTATFVKIAADSRTWNYHRNF